MEAQVFSRLPWSMDSPFISFAFLCIAFAFSSWVSGFAVCKGVCVFCLGVPSRNLTDFFMGYLFSVWFCPALHFFFFDNNKFHLKKKKKLCVVSLRDRFGVCVFCLRALCCDWGIHFSWLPSITTVSRDAYLFKKVNFYLSMDVPSHEHFFFSFKSAMHKMKLPPRGCLDRSWV